MKKLPYGISNYEKIVENNYYYVDKTEKFNPAMEFGEKELISMLYYLGYLTITGEEVGYPELKVPNKVMKEIYSEYFMQIINKETEFKIQQEEYSQIAREIALEGKIDKICEILEKYLNNLSNRDYIKFENKRGMIKIS